MARKTATLWKDLTVLNFNANGIINQSYELQLLLNKHDIDLACLTETHLKPEIKLSIRNYTIYRQDRQIRNGGGTAILIKTDITHRVANLPKFNVLEATGVYIQFGDTEVLIASVYYPPYSQMDEQDINSLITFHDEFIICGDLNAKHHAWNSRINTKKGEFLLEHAARYQYAIIGPQEPTRYPWSTVQHPDVLDICLYKTNNVPIQQDCLSALDSDHIPVLITFKSTIVRYSRPNYLARKIDWNEFTKRLHASIPGNPHISSPQDIETAVQILTDTISTTLQEVTTTSSTTPIEEGTNELTYLIRAKAAARRRWQNFGDPQAKRAFYRYQRAIRRKYKQYKIDNFTEKIKQLKPCGKDFWNFTRRILGKNTRTKNTPIQDVNGRSKYNPQEKVEILAQSFQERFKSPSTAF